ncbi:hypothetical protein [Pseudarthrobacter sp. L1SW]|uniref:hypothetical protein n=1 Tax=Pseudarthrobacter sp. L1SW TaxID=2851598 RepID=UPI001E42D74B|nr:hypothetical protein [Pseudarthrobacter sp. L1SW]UEL27146.1 hypothetical protein KTR40_10880 [Pseudarthrobacter sp. L1SW]
MEGSRHAPPGRALRTVVGVFGLLAALAGMEHGIGEILQGPVAPGGPVFRSWPGNEAFGILDGEPAFTVLSDLLASGVATVVAAGVFAAWAVAGIHGRQGPLVLIGLSLLLFAVGGGFGPPLLGIILGIGVSRLEAPSRPPGPGTRAMAKAWPWALGAGVAGYLGLVPGTLVMHAMWGTPPASVVYALMAMAFGGVILALAGARASNRLEAWHAAEPSKRSRSGTSP